MVILSLFLVHSSILLTLIRFMSFSFKTQLKLFFLYEAFPAPRSRVAPALPASGVVAYLHLVISFPGLAPTLIHELLKGPDWVLFLPRGPVPGSVARGSEGAARVWPAGGVASVGSGSDPGIVQRKSGNRRSKLVGLGWGAGPRAPGSSPTEPKRPPPHQAQPPPSPFPIQTPHFLPRLHSPTRSPPCSFSSPPSVSGQTFPF